MFNYTQLRAAAQLERAADLIEVNGWTTGTFGGSPQPHRMKRYSPMCLVAAIAVAGGHSAHDYYGDTEVHKALIEHSPIKNLNPNKFSSTSDMIIGYNDRHRGTPVDKLRMIELLRDAAAQIRAETEGRMLQPVAELVPVAEPEKRSPFGGPGTSWNGTSWNAVQMVTDLSKYVEDTTEAVTGLAEIAIELATVKKSDTGLTKKQFTSIQNEQLIAEAEALLDPPLLDMPLDRELIDA